MDDYVDRKWNESRGFEVDVPCASCARQTTHDVFASIDDFGESLVSRDDYTWENSYQLTYCMGCGTVSLRVAHENSRDVFQTVDGKTIREQTETLFPPRVEGRRSLDADLRFVPPKVRRVYDETIRALHGNSTILAGIGLRALVETVSRTEHAEGKNLAERIDDLVEKTLLTARGAKILHQIRTLGNRAAHEVEPHTESQLALAMDIVDHLLREVYIIPEKARADFRPDSA